MIIKPMSALLILSAMHTVSAASTTEQPVEPVKKVEHCIEGAICGGHTHKDAGRHHVHHQKKDDGTYHVSHMNTLRA